MIEFDWDEGNAGHITQRHSIGPKEVEQALYDPYRIPAPAYDTESEHREAFVGSTRAGRVLFVVITQRSGRIRVVTARPARRYERRHYEMQ